MVRTEVGLKCEHCMQRQPGGSAQEVTSQSRLPLLIVLVGGLLLGIGLIVAIVARSSGSSTTKAKASAPVGTWSPAPDLVSIRGTATAVVLADGKVLVSGGGVGDIPLATAELYDPTPAKWATTGSMTQARRGQQTVVLRDGRVLTTGGIAQGQLLASAELYDPATGRWFPAAPMAVGRLGHSLTVLADGRVLAAGGSSSAGPGQTGGGQTIRPDASAEIYDPANGTWASAGSMASPRFEHTATLLADGRVLMAGGLGPRSSGVGPLASTEVYDPAARIFVGSSDMAEPRTNHAAARLKDGSVLVAGGSGGVNGDVSLATAEIFDPRQNAWVRAEPMSGSRTGETATLLASGQVLVAGGENADRGTRRSLTSAEVFDPGDRSWRSAGNMACPRSEQAAVLLNDGSALVVAGDAAFPGKAPSAQSCADQYRP